MPPEVIAGRYRVEREVGRGGMGSVWLCRDERLGRAVAVKQVGGLPGESNMHLARALREARHSAALSHPNVVAIFDALEDGDHVWLVMEYVPSRTLDQLVREDGPLEPWQAAGIGADVADGLAAAHALGTVHRDVKPSNILVRRDDGRALIADFGIARTVGQEQLTRSGLVTGTPVYFAPELARGQEPAPASDVWALGVSLYVAVEGEPPYAEQANAIALLNRIASEPPPAPTRAGPLTTAIQHMLDPDPDARWTMARSADALRELAIEEPLPVPTALPVPPAPPEPPVDDPPPTPAREERPPDTVPTRPVGAAPTSPPASRPRRALPALVALLAVALVAAAGWWLTRDPGTDPSADRPAAGPTSKASEKTSDSPPATPSGQTTPSGQATPSGEATPSGQATPSGNASSSAPSSSSPPDPTPSGSTTTSSTTAPGGGGADVDSPADLVADYYGLLPEDTSTAWQLTTPEFQAEVGEGSFLGFWATIDDVQVGDAEEIEDGLVQITITYVTDGRSEQETRQLAVDRVGDGYLISDDLGAVAPRALAGSSGGYRRT